MTDIKDGYSLVYLEYGAKVSHVLAPNQSPNRGGVAICGKIPKWPYAWMGTGTQEEWETARIMQLCIGCANRLRKNHK